MRLNDECMMNKNVLRVCKFELLERLCDDLNIPFVAEEASILLEENLEYASVTLFFRYDNQEFQSEQMKISIPVHILVDVGILFS